MDEERQKGSKIEDSVMLHPANPPASTVTAEHASIRSGPKMILWSVLFYAFSIGPDRKPAP